MARYSLLLLLTLCQLLRIALAQDSTGLQLSGYGELYYGYDFNKPPDGVRPFFLYNHKQHNQPAVNLALVKATYRHSGVRASLGLMAGDYSRYNLAAEPRLLRTVFEANMGVRLHPTNNIWLDAGVLPSHIGFESALGASNWTASRSIVADNSPYYETGFRLTGTNKRKTKTLAVLLLNGWQRIKRPAAVRRPAFGIQYSYQPCEGLVLNYSSFIGSDKPDSLHAWRIYQNGYILLNRGNWGLTLGFDLGRDRNPSGRYSAWYAPVLIARRAMGKKIQTAVRAEYFSDPRNAYLPARTGQGLGLWGFSGNADYQLGKHLLLRAEGRRLSANQAVFETAKTNWWVLAALCLQW